MKIQFFENISSGNIRRPIVSRNKPPVPSNQVRVPGRVGAAFALNRNLEEVRQRNLQNKREINRKLPPMKKVLYRIFFRNFFSSSSSSPPRIETNSRSS
jgi:hypothetical protein